MFKFLIFAFLAVASASVIHDGTCPNNIKPLDDFNFEAFEGLWYEYAKYPTEAERDGKCGWVEYTADGDSVKVKNAQVEDGVQTYVDGTARFPEGKKVADFIVSFKFGDVVRENPLSIIDTDYTNYAVFFKCSNDNEKKIHKENVWIATRGKTLAPEPLAAVTKFLKDNKFETSKLVDTDFSEEACKFETSKVISEYPYKN